MNSDKHYIPTYVYLCMKTACPLWLVWTYHQPRMSLWGQGWRRVGTRLQGVPGTPGWLYTISSDHKSHTVVSLQIRYSNTWSGLQQETNKQRNNAHKNELANKLFSWSLKKWLVVGTVRCIIINLYWMYSTLLLPSRRRMNDYVGRYDTIIISCKSLH